MPTKLNYRINAKEMWNNTIIKMPLNEKNNEKYSINKESNKKNKDNIVIKSIKSKHTDASVSYRIEYNNKSIVYSGDTDYSNDIIKISRNANLLILECSNPDGRKVKGHLIPSLCGKIATRANVKKLVFTHFYPECDSVNIEKQCSKEYKRDIILAKDFMEIKP